MKTALIGYTGFVGTNIANQTKFNDYYNSENIERIRGNNYDFIVSAGTKSEVWRANQDPMSDWEDISSLLENLKYVRCNHFILFSTVLVYPKPSDVTEDTKIVLSEFTSPYGKNRYKMERFIKKLFLKTTFIRAPQLFGMGLKKNFVYDLIHDNALDFTHKNSLLQWYNLKNIWKDIEIAVKYNLPILNLAVEPITAFELAKQTRNINFNTITDKPPLVFDMQTMYAKLYGSHGKYLYSKESTLRELKSFIISERKKIGK